MGLPRPDPSLWYVRNTAYWRVHNEETYTTENVLLQNGEPVVLVKKVRFANNVHPAGSPHNIDDGEIYWFYVLIRGKIRRLSSTFQGWYDDLIEEDRW